MSMSEGQDNAGVDPALQHALADIGSGENLAEKSRRPSSAAAPRYGNFWLVEHQPALCRDLEMSTISPLCPASTAVIKAPRRSTCCRTGSSATWLYLSVVFA